MNIRLSAIEAEAADPPVRTPVVEPDHGLEVQAEARLRELDMVRASPAFVDDEVAIVERFPIADQRSANAIRVAFGRRAVAGVRRRRRRAARRREQDRHANE